MLMGAGGGGGWRARYGGLFLLRNDPHRVPRRWQRGKERKKKADADRPAATKTLAEADLQGDRAHSAAVTRQNRKTAGGGASAPLGAFAAKAGPLATGRRRGQMHLCRPSNRASINQPAGYASGGRPGGHHPSSIAAALHWGGAWARLSSARPVRKVAARRPPACHPWQAVSFGLRSCRAGALRAQRRHHLWGPAWIHQ